MTARRTVVHTPYQISVVENRPGYVERTLATAVLGLFGWSVAFRSRGGPLRQRVHATAAGAEEHLRVLAASR